MCSPEGFGVSLCAGLAQSVSGLNSHKAHSAQPETGEMWIEATPPGGPKPISDKGLQVKGGWSHPLPSLCRIMINPISLNIDNTKHKRINRLGGERLVRRSWTMVVRCKGGSFDYGRLVEVAVVGGAGHASFGTSV